MLRGNSPGRTITPRSGGGDLARDVAGLSALDPTALKQLWVTLCGAAPPLGLTRPVLIRALAYRLQERALGGLRPATRRFLLQLCDAAEAGCPARPSGSVTPGTVLVREWHGTSHQVTVLETACAWRGKRYRSLSEVARAITGTRWSGPRFFGLGRTRDRRAATNGTRPA
ncbi:MAG: DUF2924 domain-containing protein [Candidatus Binatia bacterium]